LELVAGFVLSLVGTYLDVEMRYWTRAEKSFTEKAFRVRLQ
jgi:hypothetical protein